MSPLTHIIILTFQLPCMREDVNHHLNKEQSWGGALNRLDKIMPHICRKNWKEGALQWRMMTVKAICFLMGYVIFPETSCKMALSKAGFSQFSVWFVNPSLFSPINVILLY